MLTEKMIETIEHQRLGFVATIDQDGAPRVPPKGTSAVINAKTIAFGEICPPRSIKRLRLNLRVEVSFVTLLTRAGLRAAMPC